MLEFLTKLFDTAGFPPRWHCGPTWSEEPGVGWLHVVSDLVIWVAYSAIAAVMGLFVWKRRDFPFPRIFVLFCLFIFTCGATHLVEAALFWWPAYRFSGLMKLITAISSLLAAILLIYVFPRGLNLPAVARLNDQLQKEVEQRKHAEAQLRTLNQSLEQAVADKVADLRRSEEQLHLMQHAARIGTWEIDPAQERMTCSREFFTLYGLQQSLPSIRIEHWLDLVHPGDRRRAVRDLRRALIGGHAYESEFRILREDGSVRYILAQGELRTIPQAEQEKQNLIGIHLDVTHRRELEEAIATQVDEERLRISHELHDGLGQQMTGLGFLAKSLERRLHTEGSQQLPLAKEVSDMIPQIVRDLRRIIRGLMPVELDATGLRVALQRLAESTQSRFSVNCLFDFEGEADLPEAEVAMELYRIAQEAVNNAVKHADPRQILVQLRTRFELVELEVIDDGKGLPDDAGQRGMGMKILHHRAAKLGASLTIKNGRERGTYVHCLWHRSVPDGTSSWSSMENLGG